MSNPTPTGEADWTELRDLLNLPSTDCDRSLVIHEIKKLRDHLAAERKAHAAKDAQLSHACKDHLACVQQLNAAVEALREVRDAGYTLTRQDGTNVIDAALVKIGVKNG